MKKKKQLYVILAAAAVLAAGYALISLTGGKEEDTPAPAPEPAEIYRLTELNEDEVASLEIRNESDSFELVRAGSGWVLRSNGNVRLDQQAAGALASAAMRLTSSQIIDQEGTDAARYGFDHPRAEVSLTGTDGTAVRLEIGDASPTGSGSYIRKEGDPRIYLLSSYYSSRFTAPLAAFRDRSLPAFNGGELTYLMIGGDRPVEIVPYYQYEAFASTLNPFVMLKPYKRPVAVNTEVLSKELEALLTNFAIASFIPPETPAEETGLDGSARELVLKDRQGTELHFRIGNRNADGEVYCTLEGREGIFTLPQEALGLMNLTPFDLADRFVRLVGIDLIDGFTIRTPDSQWEGKLNRIDEETTEYFYQGRQIEEDPFKDLYQKLLFLLTEGEIPGTFTPGEAVASVEFQGNSGNPGSTGAEFFEYDRDFLAVSIDGSAPEFLIGRYQMKDLLDFLGSFTGEEE